MKVSLDHIEDTAAHIKTFWFKPEHELRYEAGQFIELTIKHEDADDRGERRWFTLSSSPTDTLLSITTKVAEKPSSFKRRLFELNPGDTVDLSESMGDFVLPKDKTIPLLFIGGGIGVTPIHSMVKYLHDTGQNRTTHLLYAARSEKEIAFKELFDNSLTNSQYFTDNKLTTAAVINAVRQYTHPIMYVSGPEEMVEVFVAELKDSGVPGSRLVTDYFPGYAGQI